MRKSQDVYRMSYEKLSKHIGELKSTINVSQESLGLALNALNQIKFNIDFEMESAKLECSTEIINEWGI